MISNNKILELHKFSCLEADKSKDPSTQSGCVLASRLGEVISTGFNTMPDVFDKPKNWNDREQKYARVLHAEESAILNLPNPRRNIDYAATNWPPCSSCARLLIALGIKVMIADFSSGPVERWACEIEKSKKLFLEAGVEIIDVSTIDGFVQVEKFRE